MAKKTISPELKLKIVLEALKEERHLGDIASEHGIHDSAPNSVEIEKDSSK